MEIITAEFLLKNLRKNALTSALISTAIFVVTTILATILIVGGNTWFAIALFAFDIPLFLLTARLWLSLTKIKISNLEIIKDTVINKSNEVNTNVSTGEVFAFCGEFKKSGKIKLLQSDYDNLEIDETYHIFFLHGQTFPIAVYNTNKYKLDKELKRCIVK